MSTSIQEQDLIQTIKQLEQRISDLERQQRNLSNGFASIGFSPVSLSLPAGPAPLPNGASGIDIYPHKVELKGRNFDGSSEFNMGFSWNAENNTLEFGSTMDISSVIIRAFSVIPATTTSTGTAGDIRWNASHLYVCTAANTWRRVAIGTW
jgi:hypothetical protein